MKRLGLKRLDSSGRGGYKNKPCLTDCLFWGQSVDSDSYDSRLVNGNEFEAIPSKSNSIYFNGVSTVAIIVFDNYTLDYVSKVIDKYSEDSINLITWQTGDIVEIGLFELNTETKTLKIGFDGTNYKEHYQTQFELQYNNGTENITFLTFTFSEGLAVKAYPIQTDEEIAQFESQLFPFGQIVSSIGLQSSLKIKI